MSIDSEVYMVLSGATGQSVYPTKIPKGAILPAVTYQRVSTRRSRSHDGTVLVEPLYQVTAWSNDPKSSRALGRDIIATLEPMLQFAHIENTMEIRDPEQTLEGFAVDVRVTAHSEDDF